MTTPTQPLDIYDPESVRAYLDAITFKAEEGMALGCHWGPLDLFEDIRSLAAYEVPQR